MASRPRRIVHNERNHVSTYNGTDHFPDEHRPDLKPADPRGRNAAPNDFFVHGSIDNQTNFNAGSGKSEPFNK